jgi:hypothetical protein
MMFKLILVLALALGFQPVSGLADTSLPQPVALEDGTVATPYDVCGAGDQCASIKFPTGDEMVIYSEGAALGAPYRIHFTVLRNASTPIVEFDSVLAQPQANKRPDYLGSFTLAHGRLRLDFYTNKDGTLKPRFTRGSAALERGG